MAVKTVTGTSVAAALDGIATAAKDILDGAQIPYHPSGKKPKGSVFHRLRLQSPEFTAALTRALTEAGIAEDALPRLGIRDEAMLRRVLLDAFDLLDKRSVTVDDWLGRVFELLGPDLPDVRLVEDWSVFLFGDRINEQVIRGGPGFTFMNGYYELAGVSETFDRTLVVRNLNIRLRGQETGSNWVDRAVLLMNRDGQSLIVRVEFKTEGAKGGLKLQIGNSDERVFGAFFEEGEVDVAALDPVDLEGAKITYEVAGPPPTHGELDFENLILPRDAADPSRPHDADYLSKLGVYANRSGFTAKLAKDSRGRPYIRVAGPVDTYGIRDVLQRLLLDKSWH
jgi:hypothetical protein